MQDVTYSSGKKSLQKQASVTQIIAKKSHWKLILLMLYPIMEIKYVSRMTWPEWTLEIHAMHHLTAQHATSRDLQIQRSNNTVSPPWTKYLLAKQKQDQPCHTPTQYTDPFTFASYSRVSLDSAVNAWIQLPKQFQIQRALHTNLVTFQVP